MWSSSNMKPEEMSKYIASLCKIIMRTDDGFFIGNNTRSRSLPIGLTLLRAKISYFKMKNENYLSDYGELSKLFKLLQECLNKEVLSDVKQFSSKDLNLLYDAILKPKETILKNLVSAISDYSLSNHAQVIYELSKKYGILKDGVDIKLFSKIHKRLYLRMMHTNSSIYLTRIFLSELLTNNKLYNHSVISRDLAKFFEMYCEYFTTYIATDSHKVLLYFDKNHLKYDLLDCCYHIAHKKDDREITLAMPYKLDVAAMNVINKITSEIQKICLSDIYFDRIFKSVDDIVTLVSFMDDKVSNANMISQLGDNSFDSSQLLAFKVSMVRQMLKSDKFSHIIANDDIAYEKLCKIFPDLPILAQRKFYDNAVIGLLFCRKRGEDSITTLSKDIIIKIAKHATEKFEPKK